MANITPDSDDDYGYDLTAEEEELVARLAARASCPKPSQVSRSAPSVSTTPSSLFSNTDRPADTHVQLALFAESGSDIAYTTSDIETLRNDAGFRYRNDPEILASLAGPGNGSRSSSISDSPELTALLNAVQSQHPQPTLPVEANNVSYPDLSSALADMLDTEPTEPKIEPEQTPAPRDTRDTSKPPIARFRSFPKKPFSVSDLTSGAWCELQYFYTLTRLPGGKKTRTAAMKGGSKVHKHLEEELYTAVRVDITKKEDAFGLKLWNIIQGLRTLRDTRIARELEIWGLVDGNVVNGVIDGLTYENPDAQFEEEIRSSQESQTQQHPEKQRNITSYFQSDSQDRDDDKTQIYLFDVKTRGVNSLPSGAAVRPTKIQLSLYRRFLADMASDNLDFMRVFSRYGLDPDEPFSDLFMAQIGELHDEIFDDGASSSYASALSSRPSSQPVSPPPSAPASSPPDLVHYKTLRRLLPLLRSELRLTFPRGADSIGSLATVEYRRRARRPAERAEEKAASAEDASAGADSGTNGEAGEGGEIIGSNVFYIDDAVLERYLVEDMEWWQGRREPRGVAIEEAYKCRSCEFAETCGWRKDQELELARRARKKAGRRRKVASPT